MQNKKSFFERLTGVVNLEKDTEENIDADKETGAPFSFDAPNFEAPVSASHIQTAAVKNNVKKWPDNEEEGQLTIDMHQTSREIILQSITAGVKPEDLDISITRDMVTIKGKRQRGHTASSDDYFYQELYWGAFSRSVILPQEIDVEAAEAVLKNGVLTITLPKLDKNRVQKVKVSSN